eukprot:CAMPEP_0118922480 /NCGR_PEP_ID=MMETSP1169-20130426/1392_1 /TAXON_ID=36882 /ORGANISM="Pyramimonas obovata, Strain CCMP722" /LENGTH=165 /DNA_ID=CAMNT_0006863353 /DNA_START=91 /DNA_END=584 /DNA_ORIENTATION=+
MADAEIAEAAAPECKKEEAEHEEGDEAAAEDEDGCPAAKKARTEEPQEPVKLGPKTFASGQDMLLYFANLLRAVTMNRDLNEYEFMVMSELLKKGHHEAESKIGPGIKAFQARENPQFGNRCWYLIRTDGESVEFSYRKCCQTLMPLTEDEMEKIGLKTRPGGVG